MNPSLPVILTASTTLLLGFGVGYFAGRQSSQPGSAAPATAEVQSVNKTSEPAASGQLPAGSSNSTPSAQASAPAATPTPVVSPRPPETASEPSPPAGQPRVHKVQPGEMLGKLARRYGVRVADLKKANNLQSDNIRVGQVLTIPGGPEDSTTSTPSVIPASPEPPQPSQNVVTAPSSPSAPHQPAGPATDGAATPTTPAGSPPAAAPAPAPHEPASTSTAPVSPPEARGDVLSVADSAPATPPANSKPVAKIGTIPEEHQKAFTNSAGAVMDWESATRSWQCVQEMKDAQEAAAKAAEWNAMVPAVPNEFAATAAGYHYEAVGTHIVLAHPSEDTTPALEPEIEQE